MCRLQGGRTPTGRQHHVQMRLRGSCLAGVQQRSCLSHTEFVGQISLCVGGGGREAAREGGDRDEQAALHYSGFPPHGNEGEEGRKEKPKSGKSKRTIAEVSPAERCIHQSTLSQAGLQTNI